MNSIAQTNQQMDALSKKTSQFFLRYHVSRLLRSANACKLKGFSATLVFLQLVCIVFENRSPYMQRRLHSASVPFGKDTAYRFLNSCHTSWRRFVLLFASRSIAETIRPLTDASRRCAIIVDDSLFGRQRSKRVELLAKAFDHVSHSYTRGFRLLTVGWTDGNTFLPLTFCLLSTANPDNRINEASSSISYDAMTAHVAIVCTRYMMLAVEERENKDGRSFGELFYLSLDELPDLKYVEALRLVMEEFAQQLRAEYPLESRQAESLLRRFIEAVPGLWMNSLSVQKCA